MGYDPIEVEQAARQAARAVRKNGGAGYSEHLTASFVIPAPEDVTTDVTLMATGFKWFSSATPTKEEFLSGKLTATKDGYLDSMAISKLEHSVVAEATGAYCVRVEHLNYIVSTVTENELGTLPKPGIYYSSTPLIDKPEEHLIGVKYTFDFSERIHPIDPKYLPGVCLPVVELSTVIDTLSSEPTQLTATETEQIKRAAEKSDYALFNCKMNLVPDFSVAVICKRGGSDADITYTCVNGTVIYVFGVSLEDNIGMAQIADFSTATAGEGE